MHLKIGFSTCPNDTFIFDAMVHGKIDTEGLTFEPIMADVEELNRAAFEQSADITKLSYHAFAYLANNYKLLNAGSALGYKNGPMLIAKNVFAARIIPDLRIAIPGKYTTANLLLSIAFPEIKKKEIYLFSDIENAILNDEIDAGLIIHENRFTYEAKGLHKIIDLGEFWENLTKMPIPLGGIAVHRKFPLEVQTKINRVLARSVQFAFNNPTESVSFIKKYAQEMDEIVMQKHIKLYVNNFTLNLGETGRNAIAVLYEKAFEAGVLPKLPEQIFVE